MLTKKFLIISLIFFSVAKADDNCKITYSPYPYGPTKFDANHRRIPDVYPIVKLVQGANVFQQEDVVAVGGIRAVAAFSNIVAKWEELANAGVCPNKPSPKVCKLAALGNSGFGFTYDGGPTLLYHELDFVLENLKELTSKGICTNGDMENPKPIDSPQSDQEVLPSPRRDID